MSRSYTLTTLTENDWLFKKLFQFVKEQNPKKQIKVHLNFKAVYRVTFKIFQTNVAKTIGEGNQKCYMLRLLVSIFRENEKKTFFVY